jgi:hypothetical protein
VEQRFLTSAVGPHQRNLSGDVRLVQGLLARHSYATHRRVKATGEFGPETQMAICAFQRKVLGMRLPDGIVNVHGLTLERLQASSIGPLMAKKVHHKKQPRPSTLTAQDYAAAAAALGCEVAAIRAVADVETGEQGAFDAKGRPTILFERHYFSDLTDGIYDAKFPDISKPVAGGYGHFSEQYGRLDRAALLDADAALESASWGAFQIMGSHYDELGFNTVQQFVVEMQRSEAAQLGVFVKFIQANPELLKAIRAKHWATFAAGYNGKKYKKNHYDVKLKQAYEKYKPPPAPPLPSNPVLPGKQG